MTTSSGAIALGTSATQIALCGAGQEIVLFGMVFVNTTAATRTVTLSVYQQALGATITIPFDIAARARSSWEKAIGLQPGDKVSAAGDAAGVTVLYSQDLDTGSTPVTTGFTPRGVYSAAATYAANDVVSFNGGSYCSLVANNTGHQPDTSTAYWMALVTQVAGGVLTTRQVATSGLATGGGDLSADRTINVPAAASSDIRTGTDTTKAATSGALASSAAYGALTYAATVAWDIPTNGYNATVTLGGNGTIGAPTGLYDGCYVSLELVQDGTGSRVPSWNSIFEWGAAGVPTLQTAAGKADLAFGVYRSRTGKVHMTFRKGV